MKQNGTCCFTGSRPQNLSYGFNEQHPACVQLKALLHHEIETLITQHDISHFISGMALGVDQWAAEAVLVLKKTYPHITLESAIPCETQADSWRLNERDRYFSIASKCDKETMLQRGYTKGCMQRRNCYMVENSHIVLAVWSGKPGGTSATIKYAHRRGKVVVCINPETLQVIR
jgi:uncharacterized phage-like protein YoqJ